MKATPKPLTRAQAHDKLVALGFWPVPGSSRYADASGRTGRIVETGRPSADAWKVTIDDVEVV